MKFILSLLLLIQCIAGNGQNISDLKADDEVFSFVNNVFSKIISSRTNTSYKSHLKKSNLDTIYKYYRCAGIPLNWNIKQWEKADFNNDGFMDLFILVNNSDQHNFPLPDFAPSVILSLKDTGYKLVQLNLDLRCLVNYPFKIDRQQLLLSFKIENQFIYDSLSKTYLPTEIISLDTLIYKFNNFIEYNVDSIFPAIQSVSFSHSFCMLPCPEYKISIDKSKNITLDGYANTPYRGHYRSIIAEDRFREIFDLLTYINPQKMKDRYGETGTDGPTAYLEIKFADGSIKEIEGAGWGGTNALQMIYTYFEAVYKNQRWYR
jgi:hypothetical protein